MLQVVTVPAFQDNYIWMILHPDSEHASVVDPGDSAAVIDALNEQQRQLSHILITHHHWDHVDGIEALQELFPDAKLITPVDDRVPGQGQVQVKDGDSFELYPGLSLAVMEIPGHTLTHISYQADDALFCGDTLFMAGCGRLFEGTPEQMHHSLGRIAALPPETRVFCTHEYTQSNLAFAHQVEPDNQALLARIRDAAKARQSGVPTVPGSLEVELATNPFLRCDQPMIKARVQAEFAQETSSQVEVFTLLRKWKDRF